MVEIDRRRFLQAGAMSAAVAAFSAMSGSITRAAALPANNATGTIADIQHVVILMQENRSFDHYFGSLSGIRGFGDPRPATMSNGKSVFHQADSSGNETLPFHPTASNLGLQFLGDLAHDWGSTHQAWNNGKWDQWIPAKGTPTMAYLNRNDIPFHYALADAFTVCDAYHCSMLSATDPNRYYLWTGYVGNDGTGGGPVLGNEEAGYGWKTFPEVLQAAGVSWKVYQDVGTGLNAAGDWGYTSNPYLGNFGDNSLLYFNQYRNAAPGSALYQGARTGTNISAGGTLFDQLTSDVQSGALPQVSWIAAPQAYSEHPDFPANYGAWYVSQVLNALTSNSDTWSKTALLITYDENDGLYDHVPSPFPPANANQGLSTVDVSTEYFAGNSTYSAGQYGLGPRVPMLVVSPWSRGGWVCSQTFDHTSVLQFLEKRFSVSCPNISPWRRAVCGDLTAAFNFATPNASVPTLPSTAGYVPDQKKHVDYTPTPPAVGQLPKQEAGSRNLRAVPYNLAVDTALVSGRLQFTFHNLGAAGAVFRVDSTTRADGPWPYTVGTGGSLADTWYVPASGNYQYSVYGPNGFLYQLAGANAKLGPEVTARQDASTGHVTLTFSNPGASAVTFTGVDAYDPSHTAYSYSVPANSSKTVANWGVTAGARWYDLGVTLSSDPTYLRRFAGHVETGAAGTTDPAIITG